MSTFDTRKAQSVDLQHYLRDKFYLQITVTDQDGSAVDLSAKTLVFSIRETESGDAVATIDGGDITVSGADNNIVTITKVVSDLIAKAYYYDLDNTTDNETIMDGKLIASYEGR